jgi:hypothetical protein
MRKLTLRIDARIFDCPRWYLGDAGLLMRIPDEVRLCVAFLGYEEDGPPLRIRGTLFFVWKQIEGRDAAIMYAVTAKHNVDGCRKHDREEKLRIRINLKDGGNRIIDTNCSDWVSHPTDDTVDVSVLRFSTEEIMDHAAFPAKGFATAQVVSDNQISVGDNILITGLFKNHKGTKRNIPIMRIGNIAAMPEEKITTITQGGLCDIDAYLIEVRSTGGLSGSPVFVQLDNPATFKPGPELSSSGLLRQKYQVALLGLVHGHFNIEKSEIDMSTQDSSDSQLLNTGIAIVVPAKHILEVLNHPQLVAEAKQLDDEANQASAGVPD